MLTCKSKKHYVCDLFTVFLTVYLQLAPGCIYLLSAPYQALAVFPVKHRLHHYRDVLTVEKKKVRQKGEEEGLKKKTPDTSDSTSQPVKEESKQATKPSLPTAACKVKILLFTFGQMRGSRCTVCACIYVRLQG